MSKPNDGGDAFPCNGTRGMSLRDYFAAKAMQAIIAAGHKYSWDESAISDEDVYSAKHAYQCADAMLVAREAAP